MQQMFEANSIWMDNKDVFQTTTAGTTDITVSMGFIFCSYLISLTE